MHIYFLMQDLFLLSVIIAVHIITVVKSNSSVLFSALVHMMHERLRTMH